MTQKSARSKVSAEKLIEVVLTRLSVEETIQSFAAMKASLRAKITAG
jgi:hypothetical protein